MFKMPTYDPISIAAMSFGILLAVVWLWRFNAVVDDVLRAHQPYRVSLRLA